MTKKLTLLIMLVGCVGPLSAGLFSRNYTIPELRKQMAGLSPSGRENTRARLLTELGIALYRDGQEEEAIKNLQEAAELGLRPSLARQLYRYLAKCYENLGRLDKSIEAYQMAVNYDSKNWKRHRDLGRMYRHAKLYSKAASAYLTAVHLNPKKGELYFALGQIWQQLGFYHYAEKNLVKSLDLGQNHNEVFHELSFVFESMGRYGEAAGSWNEMINDQSTDEDWCRLIYLAYLAKDEALAKNALISLSKRDVPKETYRFYETLVRWIPLPPAQILSKGVTTPTFRDFFSSHP